MNRQMECRVWSNGEMTYATTWSEIVELLDLYIVRSTSHVHWDAIMWYTGIKDRNGKKIFEGDYLHIPASKGGIGIESSVNYHHGAFWLKGYGHLDQYKTAEVIGNIFENKDKMYFGETSKL